LVHAFQKSPTTPPTTLAGVIATLNHASRRSDEDGNGDHAYTNLAEGAQYVPSNDDGDARISWRPASSFQRDRRGTAQDCHQLRQDR
jgi:hypothetical protein